VSQWFVIRRKNRLINTIGVDVSKTVKMWWPANWKFWSIDMRRGGYLSLIFSRKRFTKAWLKYRTNNWIFSIHWILVCRCAHFWFQHFIYSHCLVNYILLNISKSIKSNEKLLAFLYSRDRNINTWIEFHNNRRYFVESQIRLHSTHEVQVLP
jgi:hypothetical protein